MTDASIIKAVDRAFKFFPFGIKEPTVSGNWVYGPLFAVKVKDAGTMAFAHLASIWVSNPERESTELNRLLAMESACTQEIVLVSDKHSTKCTYRVFTGAGARYPLEMAFPVMQLGKKLGVNKYTTRPDGIGVLVFGYKNDELVAIFCARRVDKEHVAKEKA